MAHEPAKPEIELVRTNGVDVGGRGTAAINKSLRSKWHVAVVTVIAASRRQCGLTQEQLAEALQWHRSRVAKIESGERRVDVPEFIAIAEGLKIDPMLLFARVLRWL